ncbi:MAG TPA: SRPBCC family protein [Ktedonobacteraceae bacterium]|nr:SRPBCC family protein [Ktedonobacteraceae bacterium]
MRIEKQVIIHKPIEEVFAFLTDMRNVPRWTLVKSIRPSDPNDPSVAVGKTFVQHIEFMNQHFEVQTEVTHYEPPRLFAFLLKSGPLPLESRFTLTPDDDGTQLTLVGEGEPGSVLKVLGPLAVNIARKQLDSQLNTLKSIMEG